MSYPPAEIDVDKSLVRLLLERDCPSLPRESIRLVGEGWDNYTFTLGDDLAVRLPRRSASAPLLLNEQRWLPHLAPRLPVAVPFPIHSGAPSELFPWPWSVVKWIPGSTAETHSFTPADVARLASTLSALHQPAPEAAPANPFRGIDLRQRNARMQELLERDRGLSGADAELCRALWEESSSAEIATEQRWLHGDLHPGNVLVSDGALAGIIDWGDVTAGDVATDLACAWLLIDEVRLRRELLDAYGASASLRTRARGWALYMGLMLAGSGDDRHRKMGANTIGRVLTEGRRGSIR